MSTMLTAGKLANYLGVGVKALCRAQRKAGLEESTARSKRFLRGSWSCRGTVSQEGGRWAQSQARFCAEHGTQLLVLNNEQLLLEQEIVQDLLTIVRCFSARRYGLRNYRKKQRGAGEGCEVILGHKIALDLTPEQSAYWRRACGTARFAYNWCLAEWRGMYEASGKPSMAVVKRRWNAHRKAELPWTYEVTKCAT